MDAGSWGRSPLRLAACRATRLIVVTAALVGAPAAAVPVQSPAPPATDSQPPVTEQSDWNRYGWYILGAVALLGIQAAMMAALIVQRSRGRLTEGRNDAILRAVPDLMFLQSTDGVYVDYHAPDPGQLLLLPERFLGRNMRDVLPPALLREIEPAFAQAAGAEEPVVIEYDLDVPPGNRRYEARLVRHNDQILTLVRDITERRQAAREREDLTRDLQDLAGRLIAVQEVERARIARDLHDDVGQQLAALSIALSRLRRRAAAVPGDTELHDDVASLQQRARTLTENVRDLSRDLHPDGLRHVGLPASLAAYCNKFSLSQQLVVICSAQGDFESLDPEAALCLYRIAQEVLHNVVKHAHARHVAVRLHCTGDFAELTIADDGKGFDIRTRRTSTGVGLLSIVERARLSGGTVGIVTGLNEGTQVRVQVPTTARATTDGGDPPGRSVPPA
jgi:signal transduction histidine kinase